MALRSYPVKLTDEQVKAVKAAFPDALEMTFSEMLRSLVAGGLALHQIEWPSTPEHGGHRNGAGRKKEKPSAYHSVYNGWPGGVNHAAIEDGDPICGATLRHWKNRWFKSDQSVNCKRCLKKMQQEKDKQELLSSTL